MYVSIYVSIYVCMSGRFRRRARTNGPGQAGDVFGWGRSCALWASARRAARSGSGKVAGRERLRPGPAPRVRVQGRERAQRGLHARGSKKIRAASGSGGADGTCEMVLFELWPGRWATVG